MRCAAFQRLVPAILKQYRETCPNVPRTIAGYVLRKVVFLIFSSSPSASPRNTRRARRRRRIRATGICWGARLGCSSKSKPGTAVQTGRYASEGWLDARHVSPCERNRGGAVYAFDCGRYQLLLTSRRRDAVDALEHSGSAGIALSLERPVARLSACARCWMSVSDGRAAGSVQHVCRPIAPRLRFYPQAPSFSSNVPVTRRPIRPVVGHMSVGRVAYAESLTSVVLDAPICGRFSRCPAPNRQPNQHRPACTELAPDSIAPIPRIRVSRCWPCLTASTPALMPFDAGTRTHR